MSQDPKIILKKEDEEEEIVETQDVVLDDDEKIEDLENNFLQSYTLKIAIMVFSGIACVLLVLPLFLNHSALKLQVEQKISEISGASIAINGKVSVSFLPTPMIRLNHVVLRNYHTGDEAQKDDNLPPKIHNLYARSLDLKLTIFKFIEDPVIREIVLHKPIWETYHAQHKHVKRENAFGEKVQRFTKKSAAREKKPTSSLSAQLFSVAGADESEFSAKMTPKIVIKDGTMIAYDAFQRVREIKDIQAQIKVKQDQIKAKGAFNSHNILSHFDAMLRFNSDEDEPDSSLQIISSVADIRIEGNFRSQGIRHNWKDIISSDFHGSAQMEIFNIQPFYRSYISHYGVLAAKLRNSAKTLKMSANIANKDSEIAISDIVINSDLITGSGVVDVNLKRKVPIVDVRLDVARLDLDALWSSDPIAIADIATKVVETKKTEVVVEEGVTNDNTQRHEAAGDGRLSSLIVDEKKEEKPANSLLGKALESEVKDLDLTAEINIKEVLYLNGEIKDLNAYLTLSKSGEILILPMIFTIPGDALLRLNGVVDNNLALPKFIGTFDVEGKNLKDSLAWLEIKSQNLKSDNIREFAIYSDVMLLPNQMNLDNFYLNINKGESEFLGKVEVDSTNRTSNINSDFRVNNFNIDHYFLTSAQNVYLSPGGLIRKMFWLNDIASNNRLKFRFNSLVYKGETFAKQDLELRLRRGYFEVRDLHLLSDKTDLTADILIDISNKNPTFNLNVKAKKFHYVSPDFGQDDTADDFWEDGDDDFVLGKKKTKHQAKRSGFDRFFALPSLSGLNGQIAIAVKEMMVNDSKIGSTYFNGYLRDGEVKKATMNGELFDGNFQYEGLVSLKRHKMINGSLSYDNIALKPLMTTLMGIDNIDGVANIKASIIGVGDSVARFKKNMASEVRFNVAKLGVQGYGLRDLMVKMFNPRKYREALQAPEAIYVNKEAVTVFDKVVGSISLDPKKDGNVKAKLSAPAINGILSGKVSVAKNDIDALLNVIFLSGTRSKALSINVATQLGGKLDQMRMSHNLDQARRYLGLPKVERAVVKTEGKEEVQPQDKNKGQDEPLQEIVIP